MAQQHPPGGHLLGGPFGEPAESEPLQGGGSGPLRSADGGPVHGTDAFHGMAAVADAVLYEGYLLYPYRRSSPKNRVRWQFGVLTPRNWAEADGPVPPGLSGSVDSWYQQTECLTRAEPTAVVRVRVRYLRVWHKRVERRDRDGRHHPVESLALGTGTTHLTFDEALPCETDLVVPLADLLDGERSFAVGAPAGEETEELPDLAGRVVRRCERVAARTVVRARRLTGLGGLCRLTVRTENTGTAAGPAVSREEALRQALVATHTFIGGEGLEFLSLIDPPEGAEEHARDCRNLYTFPVLAGATGSRRAVLSSPIILPDHPQVAPESPGDLHDAAEIDEILTLRTLLLTDEEKHEARATDSRAARILDRVEAMPPEVFSRLHGAIRSLGPAGASRPSAPEPAPERGSLPWWREGGDDGLSPSTDSVLVDGVPVAGGSLVRLCPRGRGSDAQDMFLAGRTARVAAVFHDVDGSVHVAVTLDDDPAAELNDWYGRFRYFRPDELRPPAAGPDEEERHGRSRAVEA